MMLGFDISSENETSMAHLLGRFDPATFHFDCQKLDFHIKQRSWWGHILNHCVQKQSDVSSVMHNLRELFCLVLFTQSRTLQAKCDF